MLLISCSYRAWPSRDSSRGSRRAWKSPSHPIASAASRAPIAASRSPRMAWTRARVRRAKARLRPSAASQPCAEPGQMRHGNAGPRGEQRCAARRVQDNPRRSRTQRFPFSERMEASLARRAAHRAARGSHFRWAYPPWRALPGGVDPRRRFLLNAVAVCILPGKRQLPMQSNPVEQESQTDAEPRCTSRPVPSGHRAAAPPGREPSAEQ
jgi:hypothetical protein